MLLFVVMSQFVAAKVKILGVSFCDISCLGFSQRLETCMKSKDTTNVVLSGVSVKFCMVDLLLRLCLLGQKILTLFEAIRINGSVFCALLKWLKMVKIGGFNFFLVWTFGK